MIDPKTNIFWERQSGGLCRMHSLNAYFGKSVITPEIFKKYICVYDRYLKNKFNISISSADFDLVNSDQTNLVSYVMKRHGIHLRYYALNTLYGKPLDDAILNTDFLFMYNFGHIWTIRKKNNIHYKVDSLSGVSRFEIKSLNRLKEIGIMVPVNSEQEFTLQISRINDIINVQNIKEYLKTLHKEKNILGNIEIPLGVSISILETTLWAKKDKTPFSKISNIIKKYNKFIREFSNGNYNNLELILFHVPHLLDELFQLQT